MEDTRTADGDIPDSLRLEVISFLDAALATALYIPPACSVAPRLHLLLELGELCLYATAFIPAPFIHQPAFRQSLIQIIRAYVPEERAQVKQFWAPGGSTASAPSPPLWSASTHPSQRTSRHLTRCLMLVNKTLDWMHTAIMRITAAEADSAPSQFDLYKLFPATNSSTPGGVLGAGS